MWKTLLAVLMGVGLSSVALAEETVPVDLEWSWQNTANNRWYIEAQVWMPWAMWLEAERNRQARLTSYTVQLVIDCRSLRPLSRRAVELECGIEDFGVQARALPADRGRLEPILQEVDEKLTGATIELVMRTDGRVQNMNLIGVSKRNRRISRIHDTLRTLLMRAIAGFDQPLPRHQVTEKQIWGQYDSVLFMAPTSMGTQGVADIAHQAFEVHDTHVIIQSQGQGAVVPIGARGATNFFATQFSGVSVFDRMEQVLSERVWLVIGVPTGAAGGPGFRPVYGQRGRLRHLPEGERVAIPATSEG